MLHLFAFIADIWLLFWLGSLLPWSEDCNKVDWFVVPYSLTVLIAIAAHLWTLSDMLIEK